MTTYSSTVTSTSSFTLSLALAPVTYEIRVPQITFACSVSFASGATTDTAIIVSSYSGAPSGGTTNPITPLRGGSPAATATAKSGGSASGTQSILAANYSAATGSLTTVNYTFQPPFDVILSPGSTLLATFAVTVVAGSPVSSALSLVSYFEELRLSWHY